ncbi:MAG TPA: type I methionyl aminopeptidase [Candidatus Paceibacterota bacterium]|nr:type I methionyl aminopeptidase [Candidatus Paceibacterota bacterium]
MTVRNTLERGRIVEAGRRLGVVLEAVSQKVAPGVTTRELDQLAEQLIRAEGDVPAFKGYTPEGAPRPYPAALCVSVNDEVVHGIPGDRKLVEGDIVSLDLGLVHEGLIVDSAVTVPVGKVSETSLKLMRATEAALAAAIAAARPGGYVGDIAHATETAFSGTGFSVVKVLGGHGVGTAVHEEPYIPNAGRAGTGEKLVEGMVLALEPIANEGKAGVVLASDGYTYRAKDGSRSAHFEHTILLEGDGAIILTRRPSEVA